MNARQKALRGRRAYLRAMEVAEACGENLGGCPYYRQDGRLGRDGASPNTCWGSCREEPECVTGEPLGGWPMVAFLDTDDLDEALVRIRSAR